MSDWYTIEFHLRKSATFWVVYLWPFLPLCGSYIWYNLCNISLFILLMEYYFSKSLNIKLESYFYIFCGWFSFQSSFSKFHLVYSIGWTKSSSKNSLGNFFNGSIFHESSLISKLGNITEAIQRWKTQDLINKVTLRVTNNQYGQRFRHFLGFLFICFFVVVF